MLEVHEASIDNNCYLHFLYQTFDVMMEFSISTLRLYIGFQLTDSLINCNAFISWCLEISIAEFWLNRLMKSAVSYCYPHIISSIFFDEIFPKLIALWLVSLFYHQSLLVLLLSQMIYWLFAQYSKLFCRLFVESLALFYYYQNPWILFPVSINILLSLFYFIDSIFSTHILESFSHFPFFESMLKEWGIVVVNPVHAKMHSANNEQSQGLGLTSEDSLNLKLLKKRYLHSREQNDILDELRSYLAQEYYAHQAFYTDAQNHVHVMPLDWDDFVRIRQRVPGHERVQMLKTYFANTYHTAWRLLSSDKHWCATDPKSIDNRNKLFLDKNLELVLSIWLAIRNEYGITKNPDLMQIKSDMFIKVLSNTNRFRNLHLHRGRREHDMDDLHADKMGDIKLLLSTLLPIVVEKHSDNYLTISILQKFLHSFVRSVWLEQFMMLPNDEQSRLVDIWHQILRCEISFDHHAQVSQLVYLNQHHKDDFIVKMNALYGRGWLKRHDFLSLVEAYFSNQQPHLHPQLGEVADDMAFIAGFAM